MALGPLILAIIFIMWISFVSVILEKKNFSMRENSTIWESNKVGCGIGMGVAVLSTFAYVKLGNN
jgi:hypothetical protein